MLKMRVFLATQLFSKSTADALGHYMQNTQFSHLFKDCESTIQFTKKMNDIFDILNSSNRFKGLTLNSSDFQVVENTITWLDNWENEMKKELEVIVREKSKAINNELRKKLKSHKGTNVTKVKVDKVVLQRIDRDYKIKVKQCKNNFLSRETAEGLRVTLYSISNLSRYLLNSCQFEYILTSKLIQDCLERFFGIIRQAGCQNDHPTFPTFMQLYHLLSVYKILKPPKFGNCRNADSLLAQRPKISFQEFKEAFSTNESKSSYREQYVQNLQAKLDGYIANECWECDDIFELYNEMSPQIINCVIYYICGFICRKMLKKTKCIVCREAFASKEENSTLAIANLLNLKNRGGLMLTNIFLYKILREIENLFIKYIDSGNVYLNVINSITESNIKLTFPCEIHKDYMISYCIQYYLEVRMRQFARIHNKENKNISKQFKKRSRVVSN